MKNKELFISWLNNHILDNVDEFPGIEIEDLFKEGGAAFLDKLPKDRLAQFKEVFTKLPNLP